MFYYWSPSLILFFLILPDQITHRRIRFYVWGKAHTDGFNGNVTYWFTVKLINWSWGLTHGRLTLIQPVPPSSPTRQTRWCIISHEHYYTGFSLWVHFSNGSTHRSQSSLAKCCSPLGEYIVQPLKMLSTGTNCFHTEYTSTLCDKISSCNWLLYIEIYLLHCYQTEDQTVDQQSI